MAKVYTQQEIDFLYQYYPIYGVKFCSEKLQRTIESIRQKTSKLKISAGNQPIDESLEINIQIFPSEKINSQLILDVNQITKEVAYFIGFFWADGYIRKDRELVIEIVKDDGDLLIDIFNKLGKWNTSFRKRDNRKETITFQTTNVNLCKFFKEFGKYAKSYESHEKILKYIPNNYHPDFIRGLIDGDGCFYISENKKRIQFSLAGNRNQNWEFIQEFFINNKIISTIQKRDNDKERSSCLRITENQSIINLIEYIYTNDENIYLPRKKEKAEEIIKIMKNKEINYKFNYERT